MSKSNIMSDENCDGGNDSSNGKRRFYIDSILHRKKCDPPYKAAEGGYLLFFLLSCLMVSRIYFFIFIAL